MCAPHRRTTRSRAPSTARRSAWRAERRSAAARCRAGSGPPQWRSGTRTVAGRVRDWPNLEARRKQRGPRSSRPSRYAEALEPLLQAAPPIRGGVGAVRLAIIGEEAVRCAGVDDDLRLTMRGLQGRAHLLDALLRDAGVGAAVESEHRRLELAGDVERM